MSIWAQLLILFVLILLNGFFAMSELALMLARKVRLETMAVNGHRGARLALVLAKRPAHFLSTVQAGITLVGICTGAISGSALAAEAGRWLLTTVPVLGQWAAPLALVVVITSVGYLSLVCELAPKQLAVSNPEAIAVVVAWPMWMVSAVVAPMVWLLAKSIYLVLRLFGYGHHAPQTVTEEEVRAFIAEGVRAGVLKPAERDMMAGVMRLADWRVRALMTPRPGIEWIDVDDDPATVLHKVRESRYSRLPVARGDLDDLLGIVQAKDLLDQHLDGHPFDIHSALREAVVIHGNNPALSVLDVLRSSPLHLAIVVDEYGSVQGIITATDILQTIVGSLASPDADPRPQVVRRKDGSWLVDGELAFDMARDLMGLKGFPSSEGEYTTVAGFALACLGRIPAVGEQFHCGHYSFEVINMEGRRIDQLAVYRRIVDTEEDQIADDFGIPLV